MTRMRRCSGSAYVQRNHNLLILAAEQVAPVYLTVWFYGALSLAGLS